MATESVLKKYLFTRLTSLALFMTFALILLGGIVHSTGSSLACPDWPLCYGQVFPVMQGSVAIEHSHRLLAASIGCLSIILLFLAPRSERRICLLALGLVIGQGLLGGMTVLYQLPTAVSTAHLATSMLFLSTLFWIKLRQLAPENEMPTHCHHGLRGTRWILTFTVLLYAQIILGGLVRHTGAAIVCPDLPFCFGQIWPASLHPSTQLHMAHRYVGVLLFLLGLGLVRYLLTQRQGEPRLRQLSLILSALLGLQVIIGVLNVWSGLAVLSVSLHLGVGAALLLCLLALFFYSRQLDAR